MSRIGFIGTGHIAAPMVHHLAARGHHISVTERNREVSAALARDLGVSVSDAPGVLAASDTVFLCLRPQQAEAALAGLPFRSDHRIVSVMAAVPEARLRALCAPASQVSQMIPLGFLQQGGCPLAAYGDADLLTDLFAPENPVVPVASEAAMNAHFAICAMVPGLLDLLATGADWLGVRTGDPARAEFYTTQLTAGFLGAMETGSAGRLAAERDALATPNTLSLQMVESLRADGTDGALRRALDGIETRLNGD